MPVDVLVCNFTRLGDLLQTQALLDDLHSAGLGAGLVCLENFAPATTLMRNVNKVWPLPGARLMADIDRNWSKGASDLLDYVDEIVSHSSHRYILNLTPSLPARILARLLANSGGATLGFGMDPYGFGINEGVWASFFSVCARKRINAPFNVADMLRCLALPASGKFSGSYRLADPPAEATGWARQFLEAANPDARGFIAMQLGASEERRRWPVAHFRELGNRVYREAGLIPLLLGSAAETGLGEEYARGSGHPYVNAVGKTDLLRLGALLRQSRMLVTNDTGTMHLASGLGVPSLSFFLATAQPWDTGPQLDNCCCLEPRLACHPCAFGDKCQAGEKCRAMISARAAGDLVLGWLQNGDWQTGMTSLVASQARVWITGHDKAGFANVRAAKGQPEETRGIWLGWLRAFWRHLLDGISSITPALPDMDLYGGLAPLPFAPQITKVLEQATAILESIAACGAMAAKNPQAGQLFLRNCERLQTLLDGVDALSTLAAFWREFRQNQGDNLEQFVRAATLMSGDLRRFKIAINLAK